MCCSYQPLRGTETEISSITVPQNLFLVPKRSTVTKLSLKLAQNRPKSANYKNLKCRYLMGWQRDLVEFCILVTRALLWGTGPNRDKFYADCSDPPQLDPAPAVQPKQ